MKTMILLTILLLISGCTELPPEDNPRPPGITHYAQCSVDYFEVITVNELIPSNCYAFKNGNLIEWEVHLLNQSLQYAGLRSDEILAKTNPNILCKYVGSLNRGRVVYCLNDGSSCLVVEDRICSKVDLI